VEINKLKGNGWSKKETTEYDDYAYQLYILENKITPMNQKGLILNKKTFSYYYEKSSMILRIDKIKKILKRENR